MRDPTGDRRLCEYVLRCPPEAFVGDGFDRLQARLLGAGVVPDAVRLAPEPRVFSLPKWRRTSRSMPSVIARPGHGLNACRRWPNW